MSLINGSAKGVGAEAFYTKTIDQSLRFNDADLPHLFWEPNDTPDGGGQKFTISFWMKRADLANYQTIYAARNGATATDYWLIGLTPDKLYIQGGYGANMNLTPTQVLRDPSAWYHIVVAADTTLAVADDRVKLYINGKQVTDFSTRTNPTQNYDLKVLSTTVDQYIGRVAGVQYFDGYLAEFIVVDNQQLDPTSFGELKSDIWIAKEYSGSYGQGTHLDFANSASIGNDISGNNHDWTVNNLVASDVVPDSPTNNFATFNPLHSGGNMVIKEGNLSINAPANDWYTALVTQGIDSGKWYAEFLWKKTSGYAFIGVAKIGQPITINAYLGDSAMGDSDSYGYYYDGDLYNNSVHPTYGDSYTDGDVIGIALDMDAGNLYFYKNGVVQNSGTAAVTGLTGTMYIGATSYSVNSTVLLNCGQDSTFAGNTTAGGNTDANGIGDFKYTVPSGYKALCTANLPDPVIDPAQDGIAGNNFDVVTYVGNGAAQLIGDVVREVPDTYPISQSLRFNDDDTAYLTLAAASKGTATDVDKCTISVWLKRGNIGSYQTFMFAGTLTNNVILQFTDVGQIYFSQEAGGSKVGRVSTSQYFNDTSSWYHVVFAYDSSLATAADRAKLWVNGVSVEFTNQTDAIDLNRDNLWFSNTQSSYIGYDINATTHKFDGYMAEYHGIDGTAYEASDFGAFDGDGLWYPITPSVTYGTNGFYLDFADGSALGDDESGNTNDWTPTNFAATDVVLDTPTNSFPTIDANRKTGHATLTEGNLAVAVSTAGWETFKSAIGFETGKWYWEVKVADDGRQFVGVMHESSDAVDIPDVYWRTGLWNVYYTGDMYLNSGTAVSNGNTFGTDDIMSIAFDADTGQFWLGENGTWYNSGDPANGTNELFTVPTTERIFPTGSCYYTASTQRWNFGQDATFAGDDTGSLGPYSDGNSVGEFYYQPPTGFLALAENNIVNDTTNVESPDLVWLKRRNSTGHNGVWDSIRGEGSVLLTNSTNAENASDSGYDLTGFHKNGFTVGPDNVGTFNTAGSDFVAWVWKGGTQAVNTDGSINSTVSANTDAGFSIATFTGNGTLGATVGHGLNSAPEMVIVKSRSNANGWPVYHAGVASDAETDYLFLDTADIASDLPNFWNDTAPTSSLVTLGDNVSVNRSSGTHVMYCFHSVDGYSKAGYYIGNGNAKGSFIYTGFRPKFLLTKNVTGATANWRIYDSERLGYNASQYLLVPNTTAAELASTEEVDFLSNGFKCRDTDTALNTNGVKYIYLAIAEQPFKYSNAR
jgi:hypothetical protein